MKQRAIVLALASASALLPAGAHAAEDFCSRLIIQAINQFCQLLPNGSTLCQPVALVGPSAECKIPERQGVVQVPLGPPTIQPLAPWAAPHGYPGLPTHPATATAAMSPFVTAPVAPTAPATVRVEAAKPVAEPTAAGVATSVAQANPPTVAAPAAPEIAVTPTPPVAPPELPEPPVAPLTAAVVATPAPVPPVEALAPAVTTPSVAAKASEALVVAPSATPEVARVTAAPPETVAMTAAKPETPAPDTASVAAANTPTDADKAVDALAHFDFDSANLTDAGRAVLDAWLAEAPKNKTIRVSGHADRLGPEPYNLKLSLRRAEAVKQYLIGKGMNPRRIELEARGESDPVKRCKGDATPATKACLAPNRRVVIDP